MKIYAFNQGELPLGGYHGIAVAEDGHIVAQCVSTNEDWLKHDLGATPESKQAHDRYIRHFPAGFEVEWVDSPIDHKGMQLAQERNQELAKIAKVAEAEEMLAGVDRELEETDGND